MIKYRDKKHKEDIVIIVCEDAPGHCVETCGQTYVIFYYDDYDSKQYVISETKEFNRKYEKL